MFLFSIFVGVCGNRALLTDISEGLCIPSHVGCTFVRVARQTRLCRLNLAGAFFKSIVKGGKARSEWQVCCHRRGIFCLRASLSPSLHGAQSTQQWPGDPARLCKSVRAIETRLRHLMTRRPRSGRAFTTIWRGFCWLGQRGLHITAPPSVSCASELNNKHSDWKVNSALLLMSLDPIQPASHQ